jgi:hypothetical protein
MGDVVGPASSLDNAIARFDGTTGKLLQDGSYSATISDEGNLAVSPTWNAAGTTFTGLNVSVTDTASAAASLLADLKVGGVSKLKYAKDGTLTFGGAAAGLNSISDYAFSFGQGTFVSSGSSVYVYTSYSLGIHTDTKLYRDAAYIFAQRNGTNAQTYRIYNTYTGASDYERGTISWGSNLLTIGTEAAGTGTARDIELAADGSKLHIKTDGTIYLDAAGQTVGNARGAGSIDLCATRAGASYVASGTKSVLLGGAGGAASASYSVCLGGQYSGATAEYALATGYYARAYHKYSFSSGACPQSTSVGQVSFGADENIYGGAQTCILTLQTNTTSATATTLNILNTAANRPYLGAKSACTVTGLITAYSDSTDGYKVASWEIKCVIERNASNVTRIVGTPTISLLAADADAIAGGWAVTSITADDTNEALAITVTGEVGTNIRWQSSLFYGQVGY